MLFQGYVTVFEKCIRQPYIYVVLTSFIDISTMTREQSKRQVLAEYPLAWSVLQMTENSLHPYHLTVYVFILVSLWKETLWPLQTSYEGKQEEGIRRPCHMYFCPWSCLQLCLEHVEGFHTVHIDRKEFDRKKNFSFVDRVWIFDWSFFEDEAGSFLTSQQSSTP